MLIARLDSSCCRPHVGRLRLARWLAAAVLLVACAVAPPAQTPSPSPVPTRTPEPTGLDTNQLRFPAAGGTVTISGRAVYFSETTYSGNITVARIPGQ